VVQAQIGVNGARVGGEMTKAGKQLVGGGVEICGQSREHSGLEPVQDPLPGGVCGFSILETVRYRSSGIDGVEGNEEFADGTPLNW